MWSRQGKERAGLVDLGGMDAVEAPDEGRRGVAEKVRIDRLRSSGRASWRMGLIVEAGRLGGDMCV